MQEILKSGNYLNEAFSDRLSLDEKLSLIITELYRIKDTTTNTDENLKVLQQQVQSHDLAIKQAAIPEGRVNEDTQELLDGRITSTEEDIVDINNENQNLKDRVLALEEQSDTLNRDMALMQGYAQKHEKQLDLQSKNSTQQIARGMNRNFTISGLTESKNENCE